MNRVALGTLVGSLTLTSAALGGGCGTTDVHFNAGGAGGAGTGGRPSTSSVANTGGMTTGTTGTTGMTSTTGTTGPTGTGGPTGTTGTGTSTTSTTSTTTGPGPASSSSGGGGCTMDPADSACVKCSKTSCCAELVPCQNDPSCVCWTGCLAQNPGNPGACSNCGNYDMTTQAFVNCVGQSCSNQCGGGSSTTGPGSSSSTSSGGGACAPAAGDSACTSCSKMKCCNDVNACAGDANCICWVTCLGNGGNSQVCAQPQNCGQPGPVTSSLFQCALTQCQGKCP